MASAITAKRGRSSTVAGRVIKASKAYFILLKSQEFFCEHNLIIERPQKLSGISFIARIGK